MPPPTHAHTGSPSAPPSATPDSTTIARKKLEYRIRRVFWTAWMYAIADHIVGRNTVITDNTSNIGAIGDHRASKNAATTVCETAPSPTPSGVTITAINRAVRTTLRARCHSSIRENDGIKTSPICSAMLFTGISASEYERLQTLIH